MPRFEVLSEATDAHAHGTRGQIRRRPFRNRSFSASARMSRSFMRRSPVPANPPVTNSVSMSASVKAEIVELQNAGNVPFSASLSGSRSAIWWPRRQYTWIILDDTAACFSFAAATGPTLIGQPARWPLVRSPRAVSIRRLPDRRMQDLGLVAAKGPEIAPPAFRHGVRIGDVLLVHRLDCRGIAAIQAATSRTAL